MPSVGDGGMLTGPGRVLADFESAWCRFRWDEAPAVRLARALVFTTSQAAVALRVPPDWWTRQVLPNRTVASCSGVRVFPLAGPSDASRMVLRASMLRTSTDTATGRSATQSVSDERWLRNVGGRWLVDVVTEGG